MEERIKVFHKLALKIASIIALIVSAILSYIMVSGTLKSTTEEFELSVIVVAFIILMVPIFLAMLFIFRDIIFTILTLKNYYKREDISKITKTSSIFSIISTCIAIIVTITIEGQLSYVLVIVMYIMGNILAFTSCFFMETIKLFKSKD